MLNLMSRQTHRTDGFLKFPLMNPVKALRVAGDHNKRLIINCKCSSHVNKDFNADEEIDWRLEIDQKIA